MVYCLGILYSTCMYAGPAIRSEADCVRGGQVLSFEFARISPRRKMGMKTLMPGACCDRRRCVGYALAAFAAIYCAWMAALGFNWEGITDGTLPACLPATASVLGLCLLATCPPPSVLGIIISLAVLGWKFQALRGAVWVSLWAAGSLSSTFTCCQLFADAPQPVEVKDEEAGAVAVGGFKEDVESARQPLRVLIRLVAYVMHLPSSVLMNLLWTIPCVVTALPRCLAGKSVT